MKRRTRFIIGFAAAAITFGTLTATIGPARFYHHRMHQCHDGCDKSSDVSGGSNSPSEAGINKARQAVPGKE